MPNTALHGGLDREIVIDVITTSNTVQTIVLGVVNDNGDAVSYRCHLVGVQNNGQRMARLVEEGNGARNSTANGKDAFDSIGSGGSTDTAAAPWTANAGLPTNWTAAIAFNNNNLELTFNADTSQTVHWRGRVTVQYHGGATAA